MSEVALIDGDLIAYRCAATCKDGDGSEIACIRANKLLRQILSSLGTTQYNLFLSGSSNFRDELYDEYKANRRKTRRPQWLQQTREYLCLDWDAEVSMGYEADDSIGIRATELTTVNLVPIIVSLDKDLRQIPGIHYNFVKSILDVVDELSGWRNFYKQLMLGDKSDNIPGYDKKIRQEPTNHIKSVFSAIDLDISPILMYNRVKDEYQQFFFDGTTSIVERNARLLYIWRKENDEWQPPK